MGVCDGGDGLRVCRAGDMRCAVSLSDSKIDREVCSCDALIA